MSKARLVITAIDIKGRSPGKVVAAYGVFRSWVYVLLARYRAEGDAAFEPRSRRPHRSRSLSASTDELGIRAATLQAERVLNMPVTLNRASLCSRASG